MSNAAQSALVLENRPARAKAKPYDKQAYDGHQDQEGDPPRGTSQFNDQRQ